MNAFIWLVIFIVLLIIEIITISLATIWFAGGALVAFVAALLGVGTLYQWILFVVISVVLLVITRPMAVKYINKDRIKTNVDSLIGKTAIVIEPINNLEARGKVRLNGMEWTARSRKEEEEISSDKKVVILEVKGVTLLVEEEKTIEEVENV